MSDCTLIDHIAGDIVASGWSEWQEKANQFRQDARDFLDEMLDNENLNLTPIPVTIDFDLAGAQLGSAFAKPVVPDAPDLTFPEVSVPDDPVLLDVSAPTFTDPPEFTGTTVWEVAFPARPGPLDADEPGDAPTLDTITLPAVPVLTLPTVPTLREMELPAVPSTSLPSWSLSAPSADDLVAPGDIFSYTEVPYDSDLLDEVVARVRTMLAGGTGIPDTVWTALWDRGRAREQETARKLIQEASEEWAARGFSLPPGVLLARVDAARQAVQTAEATLNRELTIKAAEMEQGNIQFAVAQGIALENVLIAQHTAEMQRALDVARFSVEAAINLFNARVALFNAELTAYQTEAQVFKTRIEAELAKLEVYKAQLAGQQLIGEINKSDVEIYKARIDAVQAAADLYKTQVAGVEAAARVNTVRVEAFKATVEAYGERVRAKTAEIQAYAEAVRGELARVQVYDLEASIFSKRIDAWKAEADALVSQKRFSLDINESDIKLFASRIESYRSRVQAESERIRAGATVYDGQARMYSAEVGAETARVESESRQFQLGLERARSEADLAVKQADLNIQQVQRLLALELERIKTVNNVHAQLAAATMAAVNLSAGVHESASNSSSCSTSYNYDRT